MKEKFGIVVPNSAKEALLLGKINGDTKWHDAIQKETMALEKLSAWKFHPSSRSMGRDFQLAPLRIVFDVKKEESRRKARLVVGGHVVGASHLEPHSSAVQPMSARTALTIAEAHNLKVAGGGVGNAFPRAPSLEKVRAVAREEFGERQGYAVEAPQSLCGMATVSRAFSLLFGDFIRSQGCAPSRAGPGSLLKKGEGREGFAFMPTGVGDFLILGASPEPLMKKFL